MKPILFAAALILASSFAAVPAAMAQDAPEGHDASAQAETSAEEAMLRAAIAAIQAGTPNYDDMAAELAGAVRAQEDSINPMIQAFGAVQAVDHQGEVQGAQHFRVTFANAVTDWFIALDESGQIAGLVFRPAQ